MKHPIKSGHDGQPINKKSRVEDGGIADEDADVSLIGHQTMILSGGDDNEEVGDYLSAEDKKILASSSDEDFSSSDKTPPHHSSDNHSSSQADSSPEVMRINREQTRPFVLARVESSGEVWFAIESGSRPTTTVSEKKPKESGDGDHVTPYSVFLAVVYAAVEDAEAKDIPKIIKETSKIFLKTSSIQEPSTEETSVDPHAKFAEELESLRSQRRSLSRSLYRLNSSRPEAGYTGVISAEIVTTKSNRVEKALDEISVDGFREQIINHLKNTERLHIANFVADRAQEFIANLNLEDDVSFSKSRVKDQRKRREDELHGKIRSYQIDEAPVLAQSEKITEEHIQIVKSHISSKDFADRTADDITMLTDISYHERARGEGARVNMALKGLRAFDELIAIKSQLKALDENSEISEGDRIAAKKDLIDDLRTSSDIKAGLCGTEKNPLFGVNDINSIISSDGNDLNIEEEQWKDFSKKAGTLFARLFDYERVEYVGAKRDVTKKDQNDLEKFYNLSTKHISFIHFAFKHLREISPENKSSMIDSFADRVLEDQNWRLAKVMAEDVDIVNLDKGLLKEEFAKRIDPAIKKLVLGSDILDQSRGI